MTQAYHPDGRNTDTPTLLQLLPVYLHHQYAVNYRLDENKQSHYQRAA
ncbi:MULTISPECIES: hypothetical protein [Citrobacter]|nr:hypothetical protein [Citrobacter sp. Cb009]MDM3444553.1 hypothetical protein [Citrobacter sp. Cb009]